MSQKPPTPKDVAPNIARKPYGCHTKKRYPTEREAKLALAFVRDVFPRPTNHPKSTYYCEKHDCWHLSKFAPGTWKLPWHRKD